MLGSMFKDSSRLFMITLVLLVVVLTYSNIKRQNEIKILGAKVEILTELKKTLESNLVPECNFGHCPEYRSFNTDDDLNWESVVEVPTTMNKGAGEIWIIDNGKVVFKHDGGAYVGYRVPCYGLENEDDKECNGIFISYVTKFDHTGLNPSESVTEEWRYKNGKYVLINTEKRTINDK